MAFAVAVAASLCGCLSSSGGTTGSSTGGCFRCVRSSDCGSGATGAAGGSGGGQTCIDSCCVVVQGTTGGSSGSTGSTGTGSTTS